MLSLLRHLLRHKLSRITAADSVASPLLRRLQLLAEDASAAAHCRCTAHRRIVVVHLVHGEALLNVRGKVAGGALEGATAAVILHVPI